MVGNFRVDQRSRLASKRLVRASKLGWVQAKGCEVQASGAVVQANSGRVQANLKRDELRPVLQSNPTIETKKPTFEKVGFC